MRMTTGDNKERAEQLRNEANTLFREQHYDQSIQKYTEAIELDDTNPLLYSNRSIAYLRTESYNLAIQDAEKCITLAPKFPKGFYRRGCCMMMIAKFEEAIADFKEVLKILPHDKNSLGKIKECSEAMMRLAFARCISVDEPPPVVTTTIDSRVEAEYTGPRMNDEGIDETFIHDMIAYFNQNQMIHYKIVLRLLAEVQELLREEQNIVYLDLPEAASHFTVLGDTHGQFHDTVAMFQREGFPCAAHPYVFNGDYVDRGSYSVENVLLLLAYKLLHPNYVHLNRGNHETKNLNMLYGFLGELKAKFPPPPGHPQSQKFVEIIQEAFSNVFCALPLGCIIMGKIFVVHGGLFAEDGVKIEQLQKINRFLEPTDGPNPMAPTAVRNCSPFMNELLWSDPQPQDGRAPSVRGVGSFFGPDVTKKFLDDNGLDILVRSHQMKDEGYDVMHNGRCITIFSAPDYCLSKNKAALLTIGRDCIPKFKQYTQAVVPPVPPMHYALPFLRMMA